MIITAPAVSGGQFLNITALEPLSAAVMDSGRFDRIHQAERRHVTLLVSDLTGLSNNDELWQATDLAEILANYFRDVVRLAETHSGSVVSLALDRISIIFCAPEPSSPAERAIVALEAARAIRLRAAEIPHSALRRGIVVDCAARVALASGPCLLHNFITSSRAAYTAIGPPSASAASLHTRARPGEIVCDEPTWIAIREKLQNFGDAADAVVRLVSQHSSASVSLSPWLRETAVAPPRRMFRREGEFWAVAYEGAVFRLRDSKGLRHIAQLLAQPQTEIHSEALAAELPALAMSRSGESDWTSLGVHRGVCGDAGPVLDAQAKAAYRHRLDDIAQELDEANAFLDPGRRMGLENEMDALAHQLAAAVGLRGRDRKAIAISERARVNVCRTIRNAVHRIANCNRDLGRHLSASIRTGTFCSYNPDPEAEGWQVS
jgi:class 3 adenylate cyclase